MLERDRCVRQQRRHGRDDARTCARRIDSQQGARGQHAQGLVGTVQGTIQVADRRSGPGAEVPQRPDGRPADLLRLIVEGGARRPEGPVREAALGRRSRPGDEMLQLTDGAGPDGGITVAGGGQEGLGRPLVAVGHCASQDGTGEDPDPDVRVARRPDHPPRRGRAELHQPLGRLAPDRFRGVMQPSRQPPGPEPLDPRRPQRDAGDREDRQARGQVEQRAEPPARAYHDDGLGGLPRCKTPLRPILPDLDRETAPIRLDEDADDRPAGLVLVGDQRRIGVVLRAVAALRWS